MANSKSLRQVTEIEPQNRKICTSAEKMDFEGDDTSTRRAGCPVPDGGRYSVREGVRE